MQQDNNSFLRFYILPLQGSEQPKGKSLNTVPEHSFSAVFHQMIRLSYLLWQRTSSGIFRLISRVVKKTQLPSENET